MKKVFAVTAALALLCLGSLAQAAITIDTVAVCDPGNAGELSGEGAGGYGPDRICGSVGYNYNIGKYEVTAGQYTAFLNAVASTDTYGLYNTNMSRTDYGSGITQSGASGSYTYSVASDFVNRPVNYVSYWDSCRFANWLGNGQGIGDTETGAYTLNGYNGNDGRTIQRNENWNWAVTSEDEWYKAAYYKSGSTSAGYWLFPTKSDTAPANQVLSTDPGNSANYYYSIGSPYRTAVGEFENSPSAYGTFDQGGNVMEWDEAILYQDTDYATRGLRGGSFDADASTLQAPARNSCGIDYPSYEAVNVGFRVSQVVPEPEPTYGISNRAAYHPIISTESPLLASFNFRVWGKVTILVSGNSFTVDDGSGAPVRVVAPGFGGIQDEDYASAKGAFSGEGSDRVLNAQASNVVKLH